MVGRSPSRSTAVRAPGRTAACRWLNASRPLAWDGAELDARRAEERALLVESRTWFDAQMSAALTGSLARLDALPAWRNLPSALMAAVPLHRLREVIRWLQTRISA